MGFDSKDEEAKEFMEACDEAMIMFLKESFVTQLSICFHSFNLWFKSRKK